VSPRFSVETETVSVTDLTNNNRFNNEVLGITNDIPQPGESKMYGKEPLYNETSLQRTYFASPLAFRYIEVPLWFMFVKKRVCDIKRSVSWRFI